MQINRPASCWSAKYDVAGAGAEVPVSAMRAGESPTKYGLVSRYLGVYGAAVLEPAFPV